MRKILFLDSQHPLMETELTASGYMCVDGSSMGIGEIERIIPEYTGIAIRSRIALDKNFLSKATNLRFIARAGSGMENIDVEYAGSRGIACINAPEGNSIAVAEHAIGMLLSLLNKLPQANREVRKGLWRREANRGIEIEGKTIAIIGCGHIGAAFAKRIRAFGATVLHYDEIKEKSNASMDDIYRQADILSLHVSLTDKTTYLVNDEFINRFKKNFYLINTSRGQVVNTDDLVKNLRSGKIKGACLDVLEHESSSFEKLNGMGFWINKRGILWDKIGAWLHKSGFWNYAHSIDYLIQSEKVILSPHVAGWTVESKEKIAKALVAKILRLNL